MKKEANVLHNRALGEQLFIMSIFCKHFYDGHIMLPAKYSGQMLLYFSCTLVLVLKCTEEDGLHFRDNPQTWAETVHWQVLLAFTKQLCWHRLCFHCVDITAQAAFGNLESTELLGYQRFQAA